MIIILIKTTYFLLGAFLSFQNKIVETLQKYSGVSQPFYLKSWTHHTRFNDIDILP